MARRGSTAYRAGLALWLLLSIGAWAQDPLSRHDARTRLELLKAEISALQESLTRSRREFRSEQEALKAVDLEIQDVALQLRAIASEIAGQEAELERLEAARETYLKGLSESSDQLSSQIVSAYRLGRESRLKLLLNQDSPARLGRMLAYYEYFSRAQAGKIRELRTALDTLDLMQTQIDRQLQALAVVQTRQLRARQRLEKRRIERQEVLAGLSARIDDGAARLLELTRNQADLEALLRRLANALADLPTDLGEYRHPRTRRGNLPMPLEGKVLRAFGQPRAGGLNWQGWLIEAPRGSEVSAIAYGRVAYADWLRGYGLLMIIDHGEGFMSLYGNNESLLFDLGDWVQPGTMISTVGSTPGASQGLYFELRSEGKAIDPAPWVSRP